jgi:hypothetical protein
MLPSNFRVRHELIILRQPAEAAGADGVDRIARDGASLGLHFLEALSDHKLARRNRPSYMSRNPRHPALEPVFGAA